MDRSRTIAPIFVGPVVHDTVSRKFFFRMVQGVSVTKLAYASKTEAHEMRGMVVQSDNSHRIPSEKTLSAVIVAMGCGENGCTD